MKKQFIKIEVLEGSFVLTPSQVKEYKKCISMWEKVIINKQQTLLNYPYLQLSSIIQTELTMAQQIVKDLKRLILLG